MLGPHERRLCSFAHTGGDGSEAAFWLDDEGRQQIVPWGPAGHPDRNDRQWLRETFDVTLPGIAVDVVLPMTTIDAPGSDPLNRWLDSLPGTPKPA